MFSTIDTGLINMTQWSVRQFELYTKITRKDLTNFCLSLIRVGLLVFFLVGTTRFILESNFISAIINLVFMTTCTLNLMIWEMISKRNQPLGILPAEIKNRKEPRIILILVSFLCILSLPFFIFLGSKNETNLIELIFLFNFLCFSMLIFLSVLIEYLLCTTSLPPHEKEKKVQEKEMKYMTLQRM